MLWMKTFCFYCSVRLGVIVSAVYSLLHTVVFIVLIAVWGETILQILREFIERDEQNSSDSLIRRLVDVLSLHTMEYIVLVSVLLLVHIVACVSTVYGAFKLQKVYLLPYMVTKFIVFVASLAQHIIYMIILKHIVNLGLLIGITLAGGFYILFIGYSWAGVVAMYQIIKLINSVKYRELYGEDPMAPRKRMQSVPNVKVFLTPKNNEVSAIKRKRLMEYQRQKRFEQSIVSVTPIQRSSEKMDNAEVIGFNNWQWRELVGPKYGYK